MLQHARGQACIVGIVGSFTAPGVEPPRTAGARTTAAREKGGSAVTHPGIVDGKLNDFDVRAAMRPGFFAGLGFGDHAHRLELPNGARDGRIGLLSTRQSVHPLIGAAGPCHPATLMRGPFAGHAISRFQWGLQHERAVVRRPTGVIEFPWTNFSAASIPRRRGRDHSAFRAPCTHPSPWWPRSLRYCPE
jgi:hypothetical protein